MHKLFFIIGAGRSGTTLLSRVLGSFPQSINLGEAFKYLHNKNLQERHIPCGCGEDILSCNFWSDILSEISINDISQKYQLLEVKSFWGMLLFKKKYLKLINEINNDFELLINLITNKTNSVLTYIDSSKSPSIAFVLNQSKKIDVTYIHLIKNPVDVTASWEKSNDYLKSKNFLKICLTWLSRNLRSILLKFYFPTIIIDFDKFIKEPKNTFHKLGLLNQYKAILSSNNEIILNTQHSIAGNPQKFSVGSIKLENKKKRLNPLKKIFIYLFIWPIYYVIIRLFN